jgi:hypothetical protein
MNVFPAELRPIGREELESQVVAGLLILERG